MRVLAAFAYVLVAACGQTDDPASTGAGGDALERPAVFDPVTETLDRAQGVEDTVRDSAAARRRELEAAEGR